MISSEQQGMPHGIEGENPESLTGILPVLRQQMVRFATLQLGRKDEAEDVVQEALLGALCGQERFAGRAALRSWVFGILKHKIADLLRQQRRWQPLQAHAEDELADHAVLDQLFSEQHHWHMSQRPSRGSPLLARVRSLSEGAAASSGTGVYDARVYRAGIPGDLCSNRA